MMSLNRASSSPLNNLLVVRQYNTTANFTACSPSPAECQVAMANARLPFSTPEPGSSRNLYVPGAKKTLARPGEEQVTSLQEILIATATAKKRERNANIPGIIFEHRRITENYGSIRHSTKKIQWKWKKIKWKWKFRKFRLFLKTPFECVAW